MSRELYEREKHHADEWEIVADRRETALERADERYDALLEKYHALKLTGASVPEPAPKPLERKKPDPVAEVIADVAGNNSALRKQLGAFARAEKRAGTPETDITHKLLHWGEDEDGAPE